MQASGGLARRLATGSERSRNFRGHAVFKLDTSFRAEPPRGLMYRSIAPVLVAGAAFALMASATLKSRRIRSSFLSCSTAWVS
jgi:hypothetical protein